MARPASGGVRLGPVAFNAIRCWLLSLKWSAPANRKTNDPLLLQCALGPSPAVQAGDAARHVRPGG